MPNFNKILPKHRFNRTSLSVTYGPPTVKSLTHGHTFNHWSHQLLIKSSVDRGYFKLPDVNHHMRHDGNFMPRQRTNMILIYMAQCGADGHFDDSHFVVRRDGMFCTPNPLDAMVSPRTCIGFEPSGKSRPFGHLNSDGSVAHHATYAASIALSGYTPRDLTKFQISAARLIISCLVTRYDMFGHYGVDIVDPKDHILGTVGDGVIPALTYQVAN